MYLHGKHHKEPHEVTYEHAEKKSQEIENTVKKKERMIQTKHTHKQ